MASVGRGASRKGSKGERIVSKELSNWTGEHFMRTVMSGAGGTRAVNDIRMTGDIFAPLNSHNCFSYEVKYHKTTTVENVFMNNGEVPSFWEQCTRDCRRVKHLGYSPMLIFNVYRRGDFVLMPYTDWAFNKLINNDQRVAKLNTHYTVKRTGIRYDFDTMLTNMDGLQSLDSEEVFNHYRGLKWDSKNKNNIKTPTVEEEVEKILGNDKNK